jgi:glycosyltransferase involved in cell wall biosynthesis
MPQRTPLKLLYCGNIGKKQGLLELCQHMRTLDINFHFQIRGGGGECQAMKSWVENNLDPRFEYAGLLPEFDFVKAIHAADWFVVPEKAGSACSFLPSKVIPSISVGTPILAIADPAGPLGREVLEHEIGIVVPWPQLDELANRIARFSQKPAQFTQLQSNCGQRAGFYSREQAIDRLESLLLACTPTTGPSGFGMGSSNC